MKKLTAFLSLMIVVIIFSGCDDKKEKNSDQNSDSDEIQSDLDNSDDTTHDDDSVTLEDGSVQMIKFGEGHVISTYPLIFRKNLFVLTVKTIAETKDVDYGTGEVFSIPVNNNELHLHSFDTSSMEKKWSVKVADYAMSAQKNLVAVGDTVAVVSSYIAKPWIDVDSKEKRELTFVHYKTGDVFFESEDLEQWPITKCNGKKDVKKTSNQASNGDILVEDGILLFTETGFGASFCSGKLAFTDLRGHWKLTTDDEDVIMLNKNIYFFDTQSNGTYPYDFTCANIPKAVSKLKSCNVESINYTIPFGTSGEYLAVSPFVINNGKIYFTYQKKDNNYFLGEFNLFDGTLVREKELAKNIKDLSRAGIDVFKPVIADGKIVVMLYHGENNGKDEIITSSYMAVDLISLEKTVEIPAYFEHIGTNLMLGDSFFRMKSSCVKNCDSQYDSEKEFSPHVEKTELADGKTVKIESELFDAFKISLFTNYFWNAYDKKVFLSGNSVSPSGVSGGVEAVLYVISDVDFTGSKLQKNYNNNGNAIVNTEDPDSNTSCSVVFSDDLETEDFSSQPEIEEAAHSADDKSVDAKPGETNLYPDLVDISKFETAYVPILKKVYFSSDGEPSGTGEGGIKIDSQFSCLGEAGCSCHEKGSSVKLYYPYKIYLPLHEKEKENGAPYLTYFPEMPMFYGIYEDMKLTSKRKMFLSYNAYEHDTEDLIDKIENNMDDIFDIATALFYGDYCALVENVLSIAENSLQPVDENFGSPFLTIEKQKENESNVYGLEFDSVSEIYSIEGSDELSSMQVAVGTMHNAVEKACDIIEIVSAPASTDNFSKLENLSGSLVPDKSGRYTAGDIGINRVQLIPLKSLKVKIDEIETVIPASVPSKEAVARVGIIGSDLPKTVPADNADTDGTPYISYMKSSFFDSTKALNKVLFDESFNTEKGVAGVYVEIGLKYMDLSKFQVINAGAYSQTFFFEDILFGSWERKGTTNVFTKSVVKRIQSIESDSFVYLTLEAEIN